MDNIPTMHYFGNPRHTHSMMILTEYISQPKEDHGANNTTFHMKVTIIIFLVIISLLKKKSRFHVNMKVSKLVEI